MENLDLSNKSIEELNAFQAAIEAEKESAKVRELEVFENLVAQVKAKGEVLGIKVKNYFVEPRQPREPSVKKVYRNPETGEEYTKGPKPAWLKTKLEGIDPSDKDAIKAKMNEFLVA